MPKKYFTGLIFIIEGDRRKFFHNENFLIYSIGYLSYATSLYMHVEFSTLSLHVCISWYPFFVTVWKFWSDLFIVSNACIFVFYSLDSCDDIFEDKASTSDGNCTAELIRYMYVLYYYTTQFVLYHSDFVAKYFVQTFVLIYCEPLIGLSTHDTCSYIYHVCLIQCTCFSLLKLHIF